MLGGPIDTLLAFHWIVAQILGFIKRYLKKQNLKFGLRSSVHHNRGCTCCDEHERHVDQAARTNPDLTLLVTNALALDPDRLQSRLDDAEDALYQSLRELSDEQCRVENLDRQLDRERRRPATPPPFIPALVPPPIPPPRRSEPRAETRTDPFPGQQLLDSALLEL
ncbi:hypothetical protein QCA50_018916 [Cerrena zonata]|uniref:Uncharacterized protein n=1 Tax=Cerrena zonata TaxID=2478898 RepID=A0AAW0FKH5_9APHY